MSGDWPRDTASVFVNLNGKKFHCEDCGANLFTRIDLIRLSCNGCNVTYRCEVRPENEPEGEPKKEPHGHTDS